jgi:hypothetical protein
VSLYDEFKPHLASYAEYAERASALSLEYHNKRIGEMFNPPIEEGTLATTLDARETPKSLDVKLEQLAELPIKRIIFDRVKHQYHLFV